MRRVAASVLLFANVALGQVPGPGGGADSAAPTSVPEAEPQQDGGADSASSGSDEDGEKVPFRGSTLALDNSATAHTLGLGADYQSRNPTYELGFALRARYLLWEEKDARSVGLGGTIALLREFTDSDVTTERGEWTFTDAELAVLYQQRLAGGDGYKTELQLAVPALSLPTSQVSANNGKILGAGLNAALSQTVPLRKDRDFLPSARGRVRVGYSYLFTRAVVPTNEGIERVRLDPLGRSLPSDQLSGAAFSQHQGTLALAAGLDVTSIVTWDVELGWRPAYKYDLADDVEVCNVATGCVQVDTVDDPQNFTVVSLFQTEIVIDAPRPVAFSFGYENVTLQLGSDGQRRNILYSPDARVFASLILHLDQLYTDLRDDGGARPALSARR